MSADRKRPYIRLLGTIEPGAELLLETPAMLVRVQVYELELVHGGDIRLTSFCVGDDDEDGEQLAVPHDRESAVPLRALVGMRLAFATAEVGKTMRLRVVSHERAPRNIDLRLYYDERGRS
jgi:hypothetical protein